MTKQTRRDFLKTAAAASILAPAMSGQSSSRPPNFVILFADDLGYSDLSCYGNPVIRTPNLDRMAEEGMRFTSFYAASSVCTPSRVGLMTGRNPIRAGQPGNTGPDTIGGLPLTEILLPQLLKKRGYATAAIGKWHLGCNPVEYMPTRRGFDSYLGLLYSNDMRVPWVKTERPLELYRDEKAIERMTDQTTLTERYTDEAVKFIRRSSNLPFFLYLPYAMPHLPVSASARFRDKSRGGLYGDVIETLDWSAGEILSALRSAGVDGNTMVLFASDNGPWHDLPPRMLQEGVEPWHTGTKGLLRGAKGTTYEGGFRVPGIVRWPSVVKPRQVCLDMASTLDLFPTVAKAAGTSMPEDRVYDGYDLMPVLRDGAASPRKEFYYCRTRRLEAVRAGSWKYRLSGEGDALRHELFHLERDPAEQYNVYEQNREMAARLAQKMRDFAKEVKADLPVV